MLVDVTWLKCSQGVWANESQCSLQQVKGQKYSKRTSLNLSSKFLPLGLWIRVYISFLQAFDRCLTRRHLFTNDLNLKLSKVNGSCYDWVTRVEKQIFVRPIWARSIAFRTKHTYAFESWTPLLGPIRWFINVSPPRLEHLMVTVEVLLTSPSSILYLTSNYESIASYFGVIKFQSTNILSRLISIDSVPVARVRGEIYVSCDI